MTCRILVNIQGLMRMTATMEVGCDVIWKEERVGYGCMFLHHGIHNLEQILHRSSKIAGKENEEATSPDRGRRGTAEMAEKNEEKAKA
ncbi:hypothetical protein OPV22_031847 [Ensete ventricosum]|uniref:Uncharacterized protein n=1 Tax=Ensete ventricosum TaxID=4639 RepID=A0AAV8NZK9_ENSVE|nr:hypothetical protein OPV22_031847 [Ensete ventricosum]